MNDPVDVPLRWLDPAPPDVVPAGAVFGVPLPRGAVHDGSDCGLLGDGHAVPAQFWDLATWPDGSWKWSGVAIGATDQPCGSYRVVSPGPTPGSHGPEVRVTSTDAGFMVDTGRIQALIPRRGPKMVESITVDGTVASSGVRLVSSRQTHPEPDHPGRIHAEGIVTDVTVEQPGPQRAVLKLTGRHHEATGREWLPFTVRLIFAAGSPVIRVQHFFIWDGDPDDDFLSSLGMTVDVPLTGEPYDRHVRFAGADGGIFAEAVQTVTGLRRDPRAEVRRAQLDGRTLPPGPTWDNGVFPLMRWVPTWPDYSLRQLSAEGFWIGKRTGANRPWIDAATSRRSDGYAYLGSPRSGMGVGLTRFWQSHPTGIDIRDATRDVGTLTLWLWSPDAAPMDLRFYHDGMGEDGYAEQLAAMDITYEDYEPGLGSAHGIGRTHDIQIVAYPSTPSAARFAADAAHTAAAPRLVPTPEALCAAHVFGDWDLPDRGDPDRAHLEDRLDLIIDHYLGQIDERGWHGFWNDGDFRHSYDADRHVWKYDVGGYAWDNSELATDLWLWTTFLRTGRADVFRAAEAMARHTGDVDVYHLGELRGLGTRHNVQHWGDGCKQLRIGSPLFRRPHYYLTADEHSRDLIMAQADSDSTFLVLDPTRKLHPPEKPGQGADRHRLRMSLGTDWSALAGTWLAIWEITGDQHARDCLLGTMADIASFPHGFFHEQAWYDLDLGRLTGPVFDVRVSHLSAIFGLVEICSELIDLVDVPGFEQAWLQYCRLYLATPSEQIAELGQPLVGNAYPHWHSRLLAYAAHRLKDPVLARAAWEAYFTAGERTPVNLGAPRLVEGHGVLHPVHELQIATNDAAQSSLATIQNLALIGDQLPASAGRLPAGRLPVGEE